MCKKLPRLLLLVLLPFLAACDNPILHSHVNTSPVVSSMSNAEDSLVLTTPYSRGVTTDEQSGQVPAIGADSGKIAYLSDRNRITDVWLLDLATDIERQLTQTICPDTNKRLEAPEGKWSGVQGFTWSLDGQRLAYLTQCWGDPRAQLHIYDLATTAPILVADWVDSDSYPSWSPSGNRLVFTVISRGHVYTANVKGQNKPTVEIITNTLSAYPTWSPNGEYIAYRGPTLGIPGSAGTRTYVSIVNPDWLHVEYDPPALQSSHPEVPEVRTEWIAAPLDGGLAWSHSGHYLAVATVREAVPGWVGLVAITDQGARNLPTDIVYLESNAFGRDFYNPVFSPDDEWLYFVSVAPGSEFGLRFGTIFRVQVQDLLLNSTPTKIPVESVSSEDQLAGFPTLSSEGKWLVYAVKTDDAIDLWIQSIDGIYQQPLIQNDYMNTRPAWQPSNE